MEKKIDSRLGVDSTLCQASQNVFLRVLVVFCEILIGFQAKKKKKVSKIKYFLKTQVLLTLKTTN